MCWGLANLPGSASRSGAGMSPSKMRKTRAYQMGVDHADGGLDQRDFFPATARNDREAYDLGFAEHSALLKLEREKAEAPDVDTIIRDLLDALKEENPLAWPSAIASAEAYLAEQGS